jgi:GT2 family glycosyltransferase
MTKTAVVILNYNGEKLLQQFLPSVVQYSPEAQIFVADNGSDDQSLHLLKKHFPQVSIVAFEKNLGFCGGYNKALAQITAEYYVLLNSDVEVTPSWLKPLEFLLDTNQRVAAVQPKILSHRDKKTFEYAGAAGGFLDSMGYPFCRGRMFDYVETDTGQYDDERQIFWATGACMMIRSKSFHEHGGFDEDFFAHMEEIDLCWKLNRSEQEVFYSGKSTVYHLGAGTLGYQHPKKTYLNFRNGLGLIFKHLDTGELLYKLPFRMMLDWLAAMVFLLKGQGQNSASVFRAHVHFIGQASKLRKKRREIRKANPFYPRRNIHRGLIIFDYYLRGKKTVALSSPK